MHKLGQTRSTNQRDHLLHTPDTFVRTVLPGMERAAAVVHISPAGVQPLPSTRPSSSQAAASDPPPTNAFSTRSKEHLISPPTRHFTRSPAAALPIFPKTKPTA